jgi:endonuclease/exonuclease/phosphatase family metal-dependent hydrolase
MQIRIATLNVWSLPGPLAKHKRARMAAIAAALPALELDVIAFQEVWTEATRAQLLAGVRHAGLRHIWHNPGNTTGASGLLVASRLPIISAQFEAFTARGFAERIQHMDYYSGKGYTQIALETAQGPIVIADTHLHANYTRKPGIDEYAGVRAAQLIQIAAGLRNVSDPIISLGDFNTEEREPAYALLTDLAGLRDVAVQLDRRQMTSLADIPYHRVNHAEKRIDYVFHRPGTARRLRPVQIDREFDAIFNVGDEAATFSDHAGLVASFEMEAANSTTRAPSEAVFQIGEQLLTHGREVSQHRQRHQRIGFAGAAILGLASLAGARKARQSRRQFLRRGLQAAGLLAAAGSAEQLVLSEMANPLEVDAYATAQQQLNHLRRHP